MNNYPGKRIIIDQIIDWPDEKILCVEESETKLDAYVFYDVRRNLNPQGVKHE